MEQMQFCRQLVGFNRMAFENTFNTVANFQDQMEKIFSSALQGAPWLPEDGKKAVDEFVKTFKQGRDDFKKIVEQSFEKIESSCSTPSEGASP